MTIYSGTTPPPLITIGYVTIMPCERSHKRKFPTTPLPPPIKNSGGLRPPPQPPSCLAPLVQMLGRNINLKIYTLPFNGLDNYMTSDHNLGTGQIHHCRTYPNCLIYFLNSTFALVSEPNPLRPLRDLQ